MACLNCEGNHPQERVLVMGTCRVCELVDGDTSQKRTHYCLKCKAYICDACRPNLARRAMAFAEDKTEKVIDKVKEVVASVQKKRGGRKKKNDEPSETTT